ncbi:MAG: hypothetical protein B0A82_13125 [Alkalinema sp. CACIAM 70d]|nr:MAG: hypothetical protein B0A82_13125 [Alkalinema sp. CACIAM 70d]
MQDKQKVTLYLPSDLHRQLKIRAAVDAEPMSSLAEKAICFYLAHPEVVESVEAIQGQTHRVYACPECQSSLVMREGEMVTLGQQPGAVQETALSLDAVTSAELVSGQSEEALVAC